MPRKKTTPKRAFNLPLLLTSTLLAVLFIFLYSRFRPQPISVNIVDSSVILSEGPATLSGTIRKDSPEGAEGVYYLVLDSGQPVELDITDDLDLLLGLPVTIEGELITFPEEGYLPYLITTSIITN